MKPIFISLIFILLPNFTLLAQSFKFALMTDLHVQMEKNEPAECVQTIVSDINQLGDVDFVLVTGDISEYGDKPSLEKAKLLLDKLKMPYYITMGNHDLRLHNEQYNYFSDIFGDNKFVFTHQGFCFIGFATRPVYAGGNGFVELSDIAWIDRQLAAMPDSLRIFAVTHYPLQTGDVDNWADVTAILKKYHTTAVLGGHYHRNILFNYDGIPGIIHRSTLKNSENISAYTLYNISENADVFEKQAGVAPQLWLSFPLQKEENTSDIVDKKGKKIRKCFLKKK